MTGDRKKKKGVKFVSGDSTSSKSKGFNRMKGISMSKSTKLVRFPINNLISEDIPKFDEKEKEKSVENSSKLSGQSSNRTFQKSKAQAKNQKENHFYIQEELRDFRLP